MTCKCTKCIHEDLCMSRLSKQGYSNYAKKNLIVEDCEHFKNKADFVEVVRCKDCDVPHNKWTGCPYMNGLIPPPNHFCSYGKRK
jgi:uncharacterized CHY-type Zn-finger protein